MSRRPRIFFLMQNLIYQIERKKKKKGNVFGINENLFNLPLPGSSQGRQEKYKGNKMKDMSSFLSEAREYRRTIKMSKDSISKRNIQRVMCSSECWRLPPYPANRGNAWSTPGLPGLFVRFRFQQSGKSNFLCARNSTRFFSRLLLPELNGPGAIYLSLAAKALVLPPLPTSFIISLSNTSIQRTFPLGKAVPSPPYPSTKKRFESNYLYRPARPHSLFVSIITLNVAFNYNIIIKFSLHEVVAYTENCHKEYTKT